jgi:hypothetical protein
MFHKYNMILFFGEVTKHLWIKETSREFLGKIGMFNVLIECLFCALRYYAAKLSFLIWLHKSNIFSSPDNTVRIL